MGFSIILRILTKTFGRRGANVVVCLVLMSFGVKNSEIREKFGISYESLRKYKAALNKGDIEPLFINNGYRAKSELDEYTDAIKRDFDANPPKTLREAQERIEKLTGIRRSLHRLQVFLKKRAFALGR